MTTSSTAIAFYAHFLTICTFLHTLIQNCYKACHIWWEMLWSCTVSSWHHEMRGCFTKGHFPHQLGFLSSSISELLSLSSLPSLPKQKQEIIWEWFFPHIYIFLFLKMKGTTCSMWEIFRYNPSLFCLWKNITDAIIHTLCYCKILSGKKTLVKEEMLPGINQCKSNYLDSK